MTTHTLGEQEAAPRGGHQEDLLPVRRPLEGKRPHARYCSSTCRAAASLARRLEGAVRAFEDTERCERPGFEPSSMTWRPSELPARRRSKPTGPVAARLDVRGSTSPAPQATAFFPTRAGRSSYGVGRGGSSV